MTAVSPEAYGLHRVLDPPGALPQKARRLDPSLPIRDSELLIKVTSLNIDAASFRQLSTESDGDLRMIGDKIQALVREKGKMHNPVTESGGMLVGAVEQIGPDHPARGELSQGERIATLVSLTLTPLKIDRILQIHPASDRVDIQGYAILFSTGIFAKLPNDLPEALALAALDVCGAPALVRRWVKPGMTVGIIGAGKSGALCLAQARENLQGSGRVIAIDISPTSLDELVAHQLVDQPLCIDATQPLQMFESMRQATQGGLCDLVVNCASVPNTEMGSILCAKDGGTVLFFSMATQFAASALGAEGIGKDVLLIIGNGYVPGHADLTLQLLRSNQALKQLFETRYLRTM